MNLDKLGRGKKSTKKLIKLTECMLKLFNCINHEECIFCWEKVCVHSFKIYSLSSAAIRND